MNHWYGYFLTATLERQSDEGPVVYVHLYAHHHTVVTWKDVSGQTGLVPYFYRPGVFVALSAAELHHHELNRPPVAHSVLCGIYQLDEPQDEARMSQWEELAIEQLTFIHRLLDEYPEARITLTQEILDRVVDEDLYPRLMLRQIGPEHVPVVQEDGG